MDANYTSYERVKAALEHREPDRVPFDLGGSVLTGMHKNAYRNLRNYLGLPEVEIRLYDPVQQLACIDDDLLERLEVDVRCVDPGAPRKRPLATDVRYEDGYHRFEDEWGITWGMPVEHGLYFDMRAHPLAQAQSVRDLEAFPWPDPLDEGRFEAMAERASRCIHEQKKAYILGRHAPGIFEVALWMRGFNEFLADMCADPGFAEALLDIITENKMKYWSRALELVGEDVLVVSEADDIGLQNSTFISAEMYAEFIAPRHKRLFDTIRKQARNKVHIFYHSCGAIKEMIPALIEEGVDVLNPVQVSAKDMDTKELKRLFGRDITFWGGGVDTQHVLPRGSAEQVRQEVRRRIEDLAPGGGFVFTTVHNVQADVPPQNYMAMWEALREFGKY